MEATTDASYNEQISNHDENPTYENGIEIRKQKSLFTISGVNFIDSN